MFAPVLPIRTDRLLLRPFEAADLADLRHLTAKAAIAFELCIMRAKLKRA